MPRSKELLKEANRRYYLKHKEKRTRDNKERGLRYRAESIKYIKEITNLTCSSCGYKSDSTAPFDWHHLEPKEKDGSIGERLMSWSPTRVKKEIEKCVFLCKNCHALEHERLRNAI